MANVSQSEFEDLTPWKLQIAQPHLDKHNLIGVGVFAHVYRIDKESVRKVPALDSGDLELAIKSIQREGETYLHLGSHPRVIKCITTGDFFCRSRVRATWTHRKLFEGPPRYNR